MTLSLNLMEISLFETIRHTLATSIRGIYQKKEVKYTLLNRIIKLGA